MNKIENNLEKNIINLLSRSLEKQVDIDDIESHPIRVFEAAKSIIGLNLDAPSNRLIEYINNKNLSGNSLKSKSNIEKNPETVSIYQLEEAIDANDLIKSERLITQLLNLSDGRHILEYLLELSLKQRGKSLSVIWSIYKSIGFLGYSSPKDVKNSLLIAIQCLIYDEYYSLEKNQIESLDTIFDKSILNDYQLQLLGTIYEISNEKFIRAPFIERSLESFTSYFQSDLMEETGNINGSDIPINSRKDLLQIIENSKIDDRKILSINALRAYMKNCNILNRTKLIDHIVSINKRS